jgi:hypothetical protein
MTLTEWLEEQETLCRDMQDTDSPIRVITATAQAGKVMPTALKIIRAIRARAEQDNMVYAGELDSIAESIIEQETDL